MNNKLIFNNSYFPNKLEIHEYQTSTYNNSKLKFDLMDSNNKGHTFILSKEQFEELKNFINSIK